MSENAEKLRLSESDNHQKNWKKWGPYLAERQWGTVREDYSASGNAWEFLTHDNARSKAYRWGEDGIAGICDDRQVLCFAVVFWNGKDPILKERFFGLAGTEGNHGEDVKEYYFYLDNTPTHSYMKMLYKYPQQEFPYNHLVTENKKRDKSQPEFELSDTGVFNENRYFDIFIEYAKCDEKDIMIKITAFNCGPEHAELNIIPQIWFRNTWSWGYDPYKPQITLARKNTLSATHKNLGKYYFYAKGEPATMFCENETNVGKLYQLKKINGYFKDGFHEYVVNGQQQAINPENQGTKAGFNYFLNIPAGKSNTVQLRLTATPNERPFSGFEDIFRRRQAEADDFYTDPQSEVPGDDAKIIQRQALAGMLWSKQFYYFDIPQWLSGDPAQSTPPAERKIGRNSGWEHLTNAEIISMPDKWEYPWYAAWDLAFHCITLAMVDPHLAKGQLKLLTREWYMHPNGQLPAYEWNFSDVNPPVHAWATWRVYKIDMKHNNGKGDRAFLEAVFHKLLLNFTWWVNRKDLHNRNIFQGGFLGLDNIGVFDRSAEIPGGGRIEQADGTAWMAMYTLNMMRISLELAKKNHVYEDLASKFLEHFLYIAGAMSNIDGRGIDLWDEDDQFFYDVLHTDDEVKKLKVRSMVGLIPLFAVEVIEPDIIKSCPEFAKRTDWFLNYRPDLANLVSRWAIEGKGERRLFSLLRGSRLKKILKRMLDETEFLSDYGVRSLSKFHENHPYVFNMQHADFTVDYQPAESTMSLFGGNSNWRGPVWFPVNFLIIESLQRFHHYYGDDFKVECPANSGRYLTLNEIALELSDRLARIFLLNSDGERPVNDGKEKFWLDENFKDYILFYEYFHGDSGKGIGASHQTGWTGLIAKLLQVKSV
ncbi:MAG: hypothetical protein M0Q51_11160 [Bacteroidales bacterium]|nr:hypothetical protein [Bacteroidales bacterium]